MMSDKGASSAGVLTLKSSEKQKGWLEAGQVVGLTTCEQAGDDASVMTQHDDTASPTLSALSADHRNSVFGRASGKVEEVLSSRSLYLT